MTEADEDLLAVPLSALELTLRTTNALLNNGFSTVRDLVAATELELWRLPHIGPTSREEIKEWLSANDLTLRHGPPVPKTK